MHWKLKLVELSIKKCVVWYVVYTLCRTDELKFGDLVGIDEHGNKYYQNKMYFFGRYYLYYKSTYLLASMNNWAWQNKYQGKVYFVSN